MESRRVRTGMAGTYSRQSSKAIARKRWTRTGSIYVLLMLFSLFFMGPLVFAFLSSIKDNPTEWPRSSARRSSHLLTGVQHTG